MTVTEVRGGTGGGLMRTVVQGKEVGRGQVPMERWKPKESAMELEVGRRVAAWGQRCKVGDECDRTSPYRMTGRLCGLGWCGSWF
jgi:hypothetical protein